VLHDEMITGIANTKCRLS